MAKVADIANINLYMICVTTASYVALLFEADSDTSCFFASSAASNFITHF